MSSTERRTGALWSREVDELPKRAAERIEREVTRLHREYDVGGVVNPSTVTFGMGARSMTESMIAYARTGAWQPFGEKTLDALAVDLDGLPGWSVVLAAARARLALERGQPVAREGLCAIAGLALSAVKMACVRGQLECVPARPAKGHGGGRPARDVTPESARAWLAARGVEGI
jgi:hypothetical protein